MWTTKNRARYERKGLRYPSDLTDVCCTPRCRGVWTGGCQVLDGVGNLKHGQDGNVVGTGADLAPLIGDCRALSVGCSPELGRQLTPDC